MSLKRKRDTCGFTNFFGNNSKRRKLNDIENEINRKEEAIKKLIQEDQVLKFEERFTIYEKRFNDFINKKNLDKIPILLIDEENLSLLEHKFGNEMDMLFDIKEFEPCFKVCQNANAFFSRSKTWVALEKGTFARDISVLETYDPDFKIEKYNDYSKFYNLINKFTTFDCPTEEEVKKGSTIDANYFRDKKNNIINYMTTFWCAYCVQHIKVEN